MREITKVSDITAEDIAEYLRLPDADAGELQTLDNMLEVAKAYIREYTGRKNLDDFQDFVIIVFVLVQDMYDTRTLYVDNNNINNVYQSILNLHSINLLASE